MDLWVLAVCACGCNCVGEALLPVLFLEFVVSHTFCVSEDPAGLLTDRLPGKCAIKTSLQVELDVQRPAGVVPNPSSTREEIFQNFSLAQFLCKSEPNVEERLVRSRPALSLRLNRQGVSNVLCTFQIISTCRCVTIDASTTR